MIDQGGVNELQAEIGRTGGIASAASVNAKRRSISADLGERKMVGARVKYDVYCVIALSIIECFRLRARCTQSYLFFSHVPCIYFFPVEIPDESEFLAGIRYYVAGKQRLLSRVFTNDLKGKIKLNLSIRN